MPWNDRHLAAIFADARSDLTPNRTYSLADLLGLCRRHDSRFGYSTLHGFLRQAVLAGEIIRPHRDTYLVPNTQGGAQVALPLTAPGPDADAGAGAGAGGQMLVIEDGLTSLLAHQALMDQKLDRLILMLREHVEVRHD
jgi:hypothetical protein